MEAISKNQADMTRQRAMERLLVNKHGIIQDFGGSELTKLEISRKYKTSLKMLKIATELWLGSDAWNSRPRHVKTSPYQTVDAQKRLHEIKAEILSAWNDPEIPKHSMAKRFKTSDRSLKAAIAKWLGDSAWSSREFARGVRSKAEVVVNEKPSFSWHPTPTGLSAGRPYA